MPSVFDIFGELRLESRAFEGSLKTVRSRLEATDKALDQTIARANRLGDSSATSARRFEKFSDSIRIQQNRLVDNALAFEKGEISAKKFGSVVTSVDNAVARLNSQIKDANVRLTELSETGFTRFQQQVAGAVQPSIQSKDLFKNLTPFQKTQLSFQINDAITGILSGQPLTQVAAQQGGQILQIFQMGRRAQEGVATATAAAATSEAAFATSARAAAVSQAGIAVSSETTAAAMTSAAASTTVFGVGIVAIGAALAAGLSAILTARAVSKEILKNAQDRLKAEEAIVAALNKQALIRVDFNKRLSTEAEDRNFSRFVETAGSGDLRFAGDRLKRERDTILKDADARIKEEVAFLDRIGNTDPAFAKKLLDKAGLNEQQTKELAKLEDQISTIEARIDDIKQKSIQSSADLVRGIQERQLADFRAAQKAQAELDKQLAEQRKKAIEEAIKKAEEFANRVKAATKEIVGIFSRTTENPFVKIFLDGEAALERMREATKGFGTELQNRLAQMIQAQGATKTFIQQMDNALKSLNLRTEADRFLGRGQELSPSETLQKQFEAIGATGLRSLVLKPDQLTELDRKIIQLTQNLNPQALTFSQNQLAADARLREARRVDKEQDEEKRVRRELLDVLNQLNGNKALEITIDDPTRRTAIAATSASVNARYK